MNELALFAGASGGCACMEYALRKNQWRYQMSKHDDEAAWKEFDDTVPHEGDINTSIQNLISSFDERSFQVWQAACAYKDKRITELESEKEAYRKSSIFWLAEAKRLGWQSKSEGGGEVSDD